MNEKQRQYTVKEIKRYEEKAEQSNNASGLSFILCALIAMAAIYCFTTGHNIMGGISTVSAMTLGFTGIDNISDRISYENTVRNLKYKLEMDKLKTVEKPRQYYKGNK